MPCVTNCTQGIYEVYENLFQNQRHKQPQTYKGKHVRGKVLPSWQTFFLNIGKFGVPHFKEVMDKTLTPSPWTTTENTISEYILTRHDLHGLQPPF